MNAALNGPAGNALGGILGATLGETAADTEKRIEEAKKSAQDVSGLVRKKAKPEPKAPAPAVDNVSNTSSVETNGKRKAQDPTGDEEAAKKLRAGEAAEAD